MDDFFAFFFLNALAQPAFLYKEKTDGVNLQCFMTMERPFNQKQICLRLPPKPMLPSNVQFRNMLSEQLLRTCPLTDEITKATNVSHMQMRSTLCTNNVIYVYDADMKKSVSKAYFDYRAVGSALLGLKTKENKGTKHTHTRGQQSCLRSIMCIQPVLYILSLFQSTIYVQKVSQKARRLL